MDWEAQQPERHEWVDGEIFAMTGARDAHNQIAGNLFDIAADIADFGELGRLDLDAVFYPDVLVTCDARDRRPEADLAKRHPLLIVEVLSDSTAAYDRGRKFELYRRLQELQEVLFIAQDRMQLDLFRRNGQGRWELYPAAEGEVLRLESVGLDLAVAQVYQDVLPEEAPAVPPPPAPG